MPVLNDIPDVKTVLPKLDKIKLCGGKRKHSITHTSLIVVYIQQNQPKAYRPYLYRHWHIQV